MAEMLSSAQRTNPLAASETRRLDSETPQDHQTVTDRTTMLRDPAQRRRGGQFLKTHKRLERAQKLHDLLLGLTPEPQNITESLINLRPRPFREVRHNVVVKMFGDPFGFSLGDLQLVNASLDNLFVSSWVFPSL